MNERKAINGQAVGLMTVLCLIWGFQQIAIKAVAFDISPVLQIGLRSGIAAVLVGLLMVWRREPLAIKDGTWRPGLLIGVLFALEFLFMGEGMRYTTASHMAVFLYTAPFFAAIGLHLKLPEEKLSLLQWSGIGLAFIGVVAAFFGPDTREATREAPNILLGDFLGLLAGACWGATTVIIRCTRLSDTSATKTLFYQLVAAFVVLIVATFVLGQTAVNPTAQAWASVLFQGIIVAFATYLTWFWLLRNYLASRLGVFSFMTPLFGIVFGVWLLHEPLDSSFIIGAALVSVGIIFVTGHDWIQQTLMAAQQKAK